MPLFKKKKEREGAYKSEKPGDLPLSSIKKKLSGIEADSNSVSISQTSFF